MAQGDFHKRTLTRWLIGVFVVALLMGPGPGIYLISAKTTGNASGLTLWGMPIVYVWAVFWATVMWGAVLVAYTKLWIEEDDA